MSTNLSDENGAENGTSKAVTVGNPAGLTDEVLSGMRTMDDAFKALGAVDDYADYGAGFELLENKSRLEGTPFVAVEWRFNDGDYGGFVSVSLITENGDKFVMNDGSTGIRDQFAEVTRRRLAAGAGAEGSQRGLMCRKGLRRSDYTVDLPNPKTGELEPSKATTYYLA